MGALIQIPKRISTPEARLNEAYNFRDTLITKAAEIRKEADSYRGILVGAAILTWNANGAYRIATGINIKFEEGIHKMCAEMGALQSAFKHRKTGALWVTAAAVVGLPMQDDHSAVATETLTPCKECRAMYLALTRKDAFYGHPEAGKMAFEDMTFFTSLPGGVPTVLEPFNEEHSLHDILAAHKHEHVCTYQPPSKSQRKSDI